MIRLAKLNAVSGIFGLLLLTVFSLGCGSSSSAKLRFMNVAPDQSSLNLLINGNSVASSIAYASASNYFNIKPGSQHIQIEPVNTTSPIIDENLTFTANTQSTMMIFSSPSIATAVFTDNNAAPTSGNFNLRIINAAPALGTADVYVASSCANLSGAPAVSSLAVQTASSYITLTPGSYDVCFTNPGSTFVIIDSGPQTWSAGQVRTVVGLNGQFGGYTSAVLADLN